MDRIIEQTHETKRAAFFAALSEVDGLRYHVKKCFDSKGNGFEDAGPSLRQVTELSDFTLVDLVLFLKDLTPAEVAAINGEKGDNPADPENAEGDFIAIQRQQSQIR